jgi:secretion/DNA translocation related TadE-like protein
MRRRRERGSASVVILTALGFAAILSAFAVDLARASGGRGRAQVAADAAALAAAQELVVPTGSSPRGVADDYAARNGARVVSCACDPGSDQVVVTVELPVRLPFLGQTRRVRAAARAVVAAPSGSEGLQPWFASRLACLFDRVAGLWIVSGYRTREEQARLHREKPELAAPPGRSMHERGLAADLGYPSPRSRLTAHGAAAGCGLRFPVSYEPWHVEPAAA